MTDAKRPGPRTRTPSAAVEAALVDAAETVLVRDGPGAVTVRAVATEAGVAPMGIYNRLGSKDGLIEALLIRGFDRLRAAIADRDEADPIERLRSAGMRYRQFGLANPQFYAVMFTEAIPHDLDSEQVAAAGVASFEQLVGHVRHAVGAGALREGDPVEIAQQLWSAVHGATSLELTGLVVTADPESTFGALLDTLLRGLCPPAHG